MTRYLPILLGALLIVGLTIPQIMITDRLSGTNVNAEQRAELLKLVPKDFGDWHGEDKEVDPLVQKTAGAIGAVSRGYRNTRTGERVDLWLIVGHARDVAFHTPDICYPSSGFEPRGKNAVYPLVVQGREDTPMWTNTFFKEDVSGRHLLRVFWTWYNPESPEHKDAVVWEAPTNARWHFGNTRALYKMYFTSEARDMVETPDQSACIRFAKDFLPQVDKALLTMYGKAPAEGGASATGQQPPAPAAPGEHAANGASGTYEVGPQQPVLAAPGGGTKPEATAASAAAAPAQEKK